MDNKIIKYGTTHKVKVLSANDKLITVVDENNEGYLLVGHGIKDLPKIDDTGKITFVKSDTPFKGHWYFEKKESN